MCVCMYVRTCVCATLIEIDAFQNFLKLKTFLLCSDWCMSLSSCAVVLPLALHNLTLLLFIRNAPRCVVD